MGSLKKAKPEVIETAEEKTSRLLLEIETRALTHALYVAEGVTPETVSRVIPVASLAHRATQLLAQAGIPVGVAPTTIRRDLVTAGELMVEHLKKAFKGLKFALVTDGATFKDSGKGIAIVLSSSGLKQSVLLVLEHPDALGV